MKISASQITFIILSIIIITLIHTNVSLSLSAHNDINDGSIQGDGLDIDVNLLKLKIENENDVVKWLFMNSLLVIDDDTSSSKAIKKDIPLTLDDDEEIEHESDNLDLTKTKNEDINESNDKGEDDCKRFKYTPKLLPSPSGRGPKMFKLSKSIQYSDDNKLATKLRTLINQLSKLDDGEGAWKEATKESNVMLYITNEEDDYPFQKPSSILLMKVKGNDNDIGDDILTSRRYLFYSKMKELVHPCPFNSFSLFPETYSLSMKDNECKNLIESLSNDENYHYHHQWIIKSIKTDEFDVINNAKKLKLQLESSSLCQTGNIQQGKELLVQKLIPNLFYIHMRRMKLHSLVLIASYSKPFVVYFHPGIVSLSQQRRTIIDGETVVDLVKETTDLQKHDQSSLDISSKLWSFDRFLQYLNSFGKCKTSQIKCSDEFTQQLKNHIADLVSLSQLTSKRDSDSIPQMRLLMLDFFVDDKLQIHFDHGTDDLNLITTYVLSNQDEGMDEYFRNLISRSFDISRLLLENPSTHAKKKVGEKNMNWELIISEIQEIDDKCNKLPSKRMKPFDCKGNNQAKSTGSQSSSSSSNEKETVENSQNQLSEIRFDSSIYAAVLPSPLINLQKSRNS